MLARELKRFDCLARPTHPTLESGRQSLEEEFGLQMKIKSCYWKKRVQVLGRSPRRAG